MRPKVLLLAMAAALAVLGPVFYFHFKPSAPEQPAVATMPAPEESVPQSAVKSSSILNRLHGSATAAGVEHIAATTQPAAVTHDEYVRQRTVELNELGMSNDPDSLKTILSELENSEPEIRNAALTATLDFGSKDAIPQLEREENYTTDPEEKIALIKAIEFLKLPSVMDDQNAVTESSTDSSAAQTN